MGAKITCKGVHRAAAKKRNAASLTTIGAADTFSPKFVTGNAPDEYLAVEVGVNKVDSKNGEVVVDAEDASPFALSDHSDEAAARCERPDAGAGGGETSTDKSPRRADTAADSSASADFATARLDRTRES